MSVEYLDLIDYLAIAAAVTGLDVDTTIKITDLNLADSALGVTHRRARAAARRPRATLCGDDAASSRTVMSGGAAEDVVPASRGRTRDGSTR